MGNLYYFLITFVIVFLGLLMNYFIKKRNNTLINSREFILLKSRFNLTKKELNEEKIGLIFVLTNSLIISGTAAVTSIIKLDYIWRILIGFVILMILIYLIYGLIGVILIKLRKKAK
ncbi:MAG: hypothetical protein PHF21_02540 [Bacilli bacterium]|nr:hypothetical protein [Bacilli bacterium]